MSPPATALETKSEARLLWAIENATKKIASRIGPMNRNPIIAGRTRLLRACAARRR